MHFGVICADWVAREFSALKPCLSDGCHWFLFDNFHLGYMIAGNLAMGWRRSSDHF